MLCRLLSKPDTAFQGMCLILVSNQDVQLKKYFLYFSMNALLKMDFTIDTKCTDTAPKQCERPRDSLIVTKENFDRDVIKVTSELMGILNCHSSLNRTHQKRKKKKKVVQPT